MMKNLFLTPLLCLALIACNHQPGSEKVTLSEVRFPPPVAKPDNELLEKEPPTVEELKSADPGPKDEKVDVTTATGYNRATQTTVLRDTAKKIIKEGDISFETGNLKQTRAAIIASLKKMGGYLSEENESNNSEENRKEYVLKIKIPAKNFDGFLNDVSATAVQIDSKNISIRDVTTRFIDMTTRLQNKKLLETRYLALLQKATKMSDILEVENKLTEIRSEIESEQGQLNYMSRQVAYSSLDITFYTKHTEPVDKGYTIGYKFKKALGNGWDTLQQLFFGLIGLWPMVLLIIALYLFIKRWRKRKRLAQS